MEAFYQALQGIGYTHPVHPILTYVPMGGVIAALIFGLIALIFRRPEPAVSARHSIILAFVFVFPTIFLGYVDWQYFHGGNWQFTFVMKMILAVILVVLLFIAILMHRRREPASRPILLLYGLCFLTVVGLGYFGGEIVFGTAHGPAPETAGEEAPARELKDRVTFADVSEIFTRHCTMCHKGDNPPLGLRLDSHENVMAGSENGPVVVPGKPGESELVLRIKGQKEPSMPFRQPLLPDRTIQTIVRWVEQGAPGSGTR